MEKVAQASYDSPCGGASATSTTIFAASFLHSSSVKAAAIPAVTASGPSPPPAAVPIACQLFHHDRPADSLFTWPRLNESAHR
jgi:hypothetical protein